MIKHDFQISVVDTDSIMFSKADQSPFSEQERKQLLEELNSLFPDMINWEDDGYYPSVLVVKSKNYVLFDGNKYKIKGSGLKATQKELALKEFIEQVIKYLMNDKKDEVINLYNSYVKEIHNIKSIDKWCFKKSITEKVMSSERTNETKVMDAIEDTEYTLGDKIYVYFDLEDKLKLKEIWNNDHNPKKLLKKLYDTIQIFEKVIDVNQFPNYSLKKKNQKELEELLKNG